MKVSGYRSCEAILDLLRAIDCVDDPKGGFSIEVPVI